MKTYKNILLVLGLLFISSLAFSQTTEVSYQYDASGNRIKRQTIIITPPVGNFNRDELIVEEELLEYKISIYPNPTQGELKVIISGDVDFEQSSLSVFSIKGELVYKKEPVEETNYINLLNQAPGMYVMRLLIEGKTESWKILKQ